MTKDELPKRERGGTNNARSAERAKEAAKEAERQHETFDVPQRENQGHPDGYKNNR